MAKIDILHKGSIMEVLTYYTLTDDFEDFLIKKGRKVHSVHYGYYNEFDLIIYEV